MFGASSHPGILRDELRGAFLWILDFLCALGNLRGAKRTFYSPCEHGDIPEGSPRNPYSRKIKVFHKTDRYRVESHEMLYFIRLYISDIEDISSFVLDFEWSRFSPHSQSSSVMAVREGLKAMLRGLSPNSLWSLSETIGYKVESWM